MKPVGWFKTEIEQAKTSIEFYRAALKEANIRNHELENELILARQVLDFVNAATEGHTSDFANSFPIVRAVADLWHEKRCLEMQLEDRRLDAEGVAVYIHEAKVKNQPPDLTAGEFNRGE